MTTEKKIIKTKVGVLELAKQLDNVSKACRLLGYKRGLRLVGQFLRVHKWCLAVEAYAAAGCVGRFPQYTRSGVCPSSARWGRCWL